MRQYLFASAMMLVTFFACKHDPLATMPDFPFRLADSTTIMNSSNISVDKPIVIINFEADCLDCQQMTDSLLQNITALNNARFIFLTNERFSQVTIFREYYQLDKYQNVIVGQDFTHALPKHFNTHKTPLIALYNRSQRLVGYFVGKPNNDQLIGSITSIH